MGHQDANSSGERLVGRVAVVTGGGSGIGEALAHAAAARHMRVAVADIDEGAAQAVADAISAGGGRAIAVCTDVTSLDAVEALAAHCEAELGPPALLCSNAGALAFGRLDQLNPGDWRWLSAVNVEGLLHCIAAFGPGLREQPGWRHVLVTASTHAFIGGGTSALYTATKHAVACIAESLRLEMEPHGIGVTTLCPGPTRSRILDSQRHRPAAFGRPAHEPFGNGPIPGATEPSSVAARAFTGILANDPYVFVGDSDPDATVRYRDQVSARWRDIDRCIAAAAEAPGARTTPR